MGEGLPAHFSKEGWTVTCIGVKGDACYDDCSLGVWACVENAHHNNILTISVQFSSVLYFYNVSVSKISSATKRLNFLK